MFLWVRGNEMKRKLFQDQHKHFHFYFPFFIFQFYKTRSMFFFNSFKCFNNFLYVFKSNSKCCLKLNINDWNKSTITFKCNRNIVAPFNYLLLFWMRCVRGIIHYISRSYIWFHVYMYSFFFFFLFLFLASFQLKFVFLLFCISFISLFIYRTDTEQSRTK